MSRTEEYTRLLLQLESTPEQLKTTAERAVNRLNTLQKKQRIFSRIALGAAACFTVFAASVNLSPTFAKACESVPVISALMEAVRFSASLSAAVEHDYVQPMNLTQTENGVTAIVKHLIVDRKQVSTFFTLESETAEYLDYTWDIEVPGENMGWSSSSSNFGKKGDELRQIDTNFMEIDVPDTLLLTLKVYDDSAAWGGAQDSPTPAPEQDYHGSQKEVERPLLAEFSFSLEFDPYFTAQGKVIPVNADFVIDGQAMTLTEVEIYPTHLRVNLEDAADNTAWLKGLDLYLENERGEQYHSGVNGISASSDPGGKGYATFWLDSPFFGQGKHLTLYMTGARWQDKEQNRVLVDPETGTAEGLPEDVWFLKTRKEGETYWLNFVAPREADGRMYQLFGHQVWNEAGDPLPDIMSWGHTMGYRPEEGKPSVEEETLFTIDFPLKGYTGGKVWLELIFTHATDLTETPVIITIK